MEKHLKTCADCRDRLNRMREPLALDAAAAKPVTKNAPNMTAKRAFKKVSKLRMRMVICVCLAGLAGHSRLRTCQSGGQRDWSVHQQLWGLE